MGNEALNWDGLFNSYGKATLAGLTFWKPLQKILSKPLPQFGGYSHGTCLKLGKITEKILKREIVSFSTIW